jgi:stage IV sporulation protein B
MKKRAFFRYISAFLACAALAGVYFSPQMQRIRALPEVYYIRRGQSRLIDQLPSSAFSVEGDSIEVRASGDESISSKGVQIQGVEDGDALLTLKFMGVPVRQVRVVVAQEHLLVPGGQSIGVALKTQGALVVGTSTILSSDGTSGNPAREAGIVAGDVIRSVGGIEVEDAAHLSELINEAEGTITVEVMREGVMQQLELIPRQDAQDGKMRLGMWVRDSTAGVGTLTFYDPRSESFGALGHAITDIDTRTRLLVREGEIMLSKIVDVKVGTKGNPGELRGSFSSDDAIGSINKNCEYGIFGQAYQKINNSLYPEGLPVALQEEVHTGPAEILTTIDGNGVQSYGCEILRLQPQDSPAQRGMVINITDERLLSATGGIVQGMSGSPIIQDGRIVGAVTHVLVNDPTKGYGMFIEWMLGQND